MSSRARARCSCRPAGKIQNREIPSFQRMPHPCPLTEESVPAMAGTRPFAMTDWHWRQCRTILRRANSEGDRREDGMKRSASVSLTVVAAVSMAARGQQRLDPCAAASFNEQACQAAIQSRGYCWNGRWVPLKYHYPFPYYYDAYQDYAANGGVVNAAVVGSCGPPAPVVFGAHGAAHGGFGATGVCHGAHS